MSSFNKVFLMGNLTKDVELRYTPSNVGIASFTLAVNSNIGKDSEGNAKQETLFIDVTAFGKQAEVIAQYCKKGSPLFVEGRIRLQQWEKDGVKHSKHIIILNGFQLIGSKPKDIADSVDADTGVDNEDVPF